jgi:hypothetical protein
MVIFEPAAISKVMYAYRQAFWQTYGATSRQFKQ